MEVFWIAVDNGWDVVKHGCRAADVSVAAAVIHMSRFLKVARDC